MKPRLRFRWSDRTWMSGCARFGNSEEDIIGILLGNAYAADWGRIDCYRAVSRLLGGERSAQVIGHWAKELRA